MEDVYIITMSAGQIDSVTIIDPDYAEHTARQLRSSGKSVRLFRERQKYLDFVQKCDADRKWQQSMMNFCFSG